MITRTMDETAFRNIISSNADGIIMVDREGSVIFANPAAESLFGRSETTLLGEPFGFPITGGETAEIEIYSSPGRGKSVEMRAVETTWQGTPAILVSMRDITLRKLAEEALKESARFVRATLDAISSHVAVLDESGLIVTVNQAWRDFANHNPPVMGNVSEGANYLAVCNRAAERGSAEAAVFVAGLRSVISGDSESFEMEYPCHSPVEERWFVARVTRFPGEGPMRVVVLHTNITERKLAEEAVKRERDFASALVDTVGSLVVVADRQGRIVRFNHTGERITGYSAEEVIGKTFWDIFLLPEEMEGVRAVYDELTSGHFPNSHENHWVTKRGERRLISWSNTALLDESGEVEFVIATGADITEQRRAKEALEESETRFRLLAENSPDIIYRFRLKPEPGFEYVSPAATAMVGYTPEEHYADPSLGFKLVLPEDVHILEAAASSPSREPILLRWVRKDGTIVWTEQRNMPVHDSSGELVAIEGIARDVTERKKADDLRQEYTSLISHDLRNPLTLVMGQASWLQRRLADRGLTQELKAAEQITSGARRMNDMIQDLVDSAKLESGTLPMDLEPTDLCLMVTELVERIRRPGERSRILVDCPTWVPPVLADPARTERAVENLLSNALKYSPPETNVLLRLERTGDQVVLSVEDMGAGVPAEDLPYLFDRFYRARNVGKAQGLGLGLYITRLIAEAQGGRVWADSEVGKGSTFHLSLPVAASDP